MIDKVVTLRCSCHLKDHNLIVEYDTDNDQYIFNAQYSVDIPWWHRVLLAVKFVLGLRPGKTNYAETWVTPDQLYDFIDHFKFRNH